MPRTRIAHSRTRSGMTLIEVMIASTVMAMTALALATLADAVQVADQHVTGQGTATQHARVAMDRINRIARQAWANEKFPGVLVMADEVAGWEFPDTVVVWYPDPKLTDANDNLLYPDGTPANPDGLPLFRELVIFCPNPNSPGELLEITVPDDNTVVPADFATLVSEIDYIKTDSSAQRIVLTDLVRVADVTELAANAAGRKRAAVRFEVEYHPTESQWAQFLAGTRTWEQIEWPQSIYGNTSGLRQVWLRSELQLVTQTKDEASRTQQAFAIPFLGSAAVYYRMRKSPPP